MKKRESNFVKYWEKQTSIKLFDIERFRKDAYMYFELYNTGAISRFCKENNIDRATFWRTITGRTTVVTQVHSKVCELMGKELKHYLNEK